MSRSRGVIKGAGEPVDAFGDLLVGGFERVVGVGRCGVGYGPVQPRRVGGLGLAVQFFVGSVADGDDEVAGSHDVVDVCGPGSSKREFVTSSDADGAGVDPSCGPGAG